MKKSVLIVLIVVLAAIIIALSIYILYGDVSENSNYTNGEMNESDNETTNGEDQSESIIINGEVISTSCSINTDCRLVDTSLDYSTCYPGACIPINYSADSWIGVNSNSFLIFRNVAEPENCGAPPGCAAQPIDDSFEANCIEGLCEKIPK